MKKNIEKKVSEEKVNEIRKEMRKYIQDYKDWYKIFSWAQDQGTLNVALDDLNIAKEKYKECVKDLALYGIKTPILESELNYLEIKN